jgi:hypothetical protein
MNADKAENQTWLGPILSSGQIVPSQLRIRAKQEKKRISGRDFADVSERPDAEQKKDALLRRERQRAKKMEVCFWTFSSTR